MMKQLIIKQKRDQSQQDLLNNSIKSMSSCLYISGGQQMKQRYLTIITTINRVKVLPVHTSRQTI
jgi:hypothetical protein